MKPRVSIIVPCYNEQATIRFLLEAILAQTYPRPRLEVVIVDGQSQDGTRAVISSVQEENPDLAVWVLENERRTIPSSLNLALQAAHGDILVRLDAHSVPIPEYVERCVVDLEAGKGWIVGGVWEIRPGAGGWLAAGIAAAAAHPLGVGDARYRLASRAGAVDTVPFGAFYRSLIERIGGYDETLLTNEDYEFNTRIRFSGGAVWLDPEIRSTYFARASLKELARQYWRYGYWKFIMLRRYPDSLRWRQALPPVFVFSLAAWLLISWFWRPGMILLSFEIGLYLLVLAAAALRLAIRRRQPSLSVGLGLAIVTMHFTWGSGFLWSLVSAPFSQTHG